MTSTDLLDLLIATLVREVGGNRRKWRTAIGPVRIYSTATHAHCNWAVAPSGTARENAEIERIVDGMRLQHPIIGS
ncbi:hypothetical protein PX699_09040 [Sphingobium sp. H39-3-25]|uniref:hypothetical protein n=1 Tax=Sphingobium arseniciresistens TaxID=3030834 RepID=UPI0023B93D38|nr:hypothetical protein [Sphingobium arseniciresistens]